VKVDYFAFAAAGYTHGAPYAAERSKIATMSQ
jgi:hypothetical protein